MQQKHFMSIEGREGSCDGRRRILGKFAGNLAMQFAKELILQK